MIERTASDFEGKIKHREYKIRIYNSFSNNFTQNTGCSYTKLNNITLVNKCLREVIFYVIRRATECSKMCLFRLHCTMGYVHSNSPTRYNLLCLLASGDLLKLFALPIRHPWFSSDALPSLPPSHPSAFPSLPPSLSNSLQFHYNF